MSAAIGGSNIWQESLKRNIFYLLQLASHLDLSIYHLLGVAGDTEIN